MSVAGLLGSVLPFGIQRLVVGLGNPGSQYEDTPHNVGFLVVDALARQLKAPWKKHKKLNSQVAVVSLAGVTTLLVKPLTYMNRSGEAVAPLVALYDIPLEQVFVVVDEINLPHGKLRIRANGSAGGQNGMKHIIASLKQQQGFPRLRVGIGPQPANMALEEFVLAAYSQERLETLPTVLARACQCIDVFFTAGIAEAQQQFNS
jgi:PTH1 family peptidyl-tRNA hydrolase